MTDGQTILITGASDGIGLALAQHYRARGARLLLIGRRPATGLDPQLFTPQSYCRVDLAQPYAPALVAKFLHQRQVHHLDLLIHNAGVGYYGPASDQPPPSIDLLLQTNLYAPIALTHALLPLLIAAHGRIVCIGSVAAALPVPEYAVYGATKAALEGFARSLRIELRNQVGVQVIHPGATRTAMHAKIGVPLERIGWRRFPPPERVAHQILRAIDSQAAVATLGVGNRLARIAGRYAGSLIDWAVTRQKGA